MPTLPVSVTTNFVVPPGSFTTNLSAAKAAEGRELRAKSNVKEAKSVEHRVKIKSKERRAESEELSAINARRKAHSVFT